LLKHNSFPVRGEEFNSTGRTHYLSIAHRLSTREHATFTSIHIGTIAQDHRVLISAAIQSPPEKLAVAAPGIQFPRALMGGKKTSVLLARIAVTIAADLCGSGIADRGELPQIQLALLTRHHERHKIHRELSVRPKSDHTCTRSLPISGRAIFLPHRLRP